MIFTHMGLAGTLAYLATEASEASYMEVDIASVKGGPGPGPPPTDRSHRFSRKRVTLDENLDFRSPLFHESR